MKRLLPIYLALVSRIHGGLIKAPKTVKNLLWAAPFGYVTFEAYQSVSAVSAILAATFATAVCMAGKATGHGGGMDLATNPKEPYAGRKPEKLEHLIYWLHDDIPRYWYDALLLAIVGLVAVLGAVIPLAYINPIAALILAIGGMSKAVAYMIGWAVYPSGEGNGVNGFNESTQLGEFLTGLFAGLTLLAAWWIVT